ncbi:MAG: ATP-binding protein [Candidatus Gastranaerophilales bacterium]|nr:ATP-binding protein [Candidatus Gastranaerophilales bacterium]
MKRLKIAEQVLIVQVFALIVPLVVAALIIINTNQIAVKKELVYSAEIVGNGIVNKLNTLEDFESHSMFYTFQALSRMKGKERENFLSLIEHSDTGIEKIELKKENQSAEFTNKYIPDKKQVLFSRKIDNDYYVTKLVNINYLKKKLFENFDAEDRLVFIVDKNKQLVMSVNYDKAKFDTLMPLIPKETYPLVPTTFYKDKNQPNVAIYYPNLDWYIVISTPKQLINYGIISARHKIILSIFIAALAVFLLFSAYTYSLYINIRQLFKGINAIGHGNYMRKIRIIKNIFTPSETLFLANEINKMVERINLSHKKLQASNEKLKKMDEYKSNLIDTVSHEFRTPLTSIKGYTSRLLRHNVNLDEETKKQSLKVIKSQAERLSRMVNDLLVIPDIESSSLRLDLKAINIKEIIELSILSTSKSENSTFELNISETLPSVLADEDKLIQIFVNLFENAIKYSVEDTPITICAVENENFIKVSVKNLCKKISQETANKLFEKFVRIDTDLTRTTRGTGLGLFIVKGLIEAMNGQITLKTDDYFEIVFTIPVYKELEDTEIEEY